MPEARRWEDLHADVLREVFSRVGLWDRFCVIPFVCMQWRTVARPTPKRRRSLRLCSRARSIPMAEARRWEELPGDVLSEVFSRVGLWDRFFAIPLVCRQWRKAARGPNTWKRMDLRHAYTVAYAKRFLEKYGCFSHTRIFRAVVRRSLPALPSVINSTSSSLTSVTHFLLPPDRLYWGRLTNEDLLLLGIWCPRMKVVGYVCIYNEQQILKLINKWTELEELAMQGRMLYTKHILAEIRKHCVNFTSLHICDNYLDENDAAGIVTCFPELKNLQIRNCNISKDGLMKILEGCEQLACLSVRYCYGFVLDDEILNCGARIKRFICDGCVPLSSRWNVADRIDYELSDVMRL